MADAISVKLDLYRGTEETRGVVFTRFDRAIRYGIVTKGGTGELTRAEAIQAAYDDAGDIHPTVPLLPLARIKAMKFGPQKCWVQLIYHYAGTQWGGTLPNTPAFLSARSQRGYESVTIYTNSDTDFFEGYPNGELLMGEPNLFDPTRYPNSRTFSFPVVHYTVSTVLSVNPSGVTFDLVSQTNSDSISLAGTTFIANQLRFDGADVDWVFDSDDNLIYIVDYHFTATHQWLVQTVFWDPLLLPNGQWSVRFDDRYKRGAFSGNFPVHL